jgi:hypothetical protein
MCRYWFIITSGKYCSMSAETNANINLQLAPMALDVTLIARRGIETVSAPSGALAAKSQSGQATCELHLSENKPVEVHLKLGRRDPLDWVNWVA